MSRELNGVNQAIRVGDVAAVDITGTVLTLSAWVRPDVATTSHLIAKWDNGAPNAWQYAMGIGNTGGLFALAGSGDGTTNEGLFPGVAGGFRAMRRFYHAAMVRDGTGAGSIRAYLNGNEVVSATSAGSIPNLAVPLQLGAPGGAGEVEDAEALDGLLCECAVWNEALTVAEIRALANREHPAAVHPSGLAGYWRLAGIDSPEPDSSGNGNDGTLVGAPLQGDAHVVLGTRRPNYSLFPKARLRRVAA